MSRIYLIAGASGQIGGKIARRLLDAGQTVRALGRSPESLAPLVAQGAEARVGSLLDVAFVTRALTGADAAFLLIPPNPASPDYPAEQAATSAALVSAVRDSGIPNVLTLSSVGADTLGNGPIDGLHRNEAAFKALEGRSILHLRPAYFMENHLESIGLIKSMGVNGSAVAPDLSFGMIATRDIAAVAERRLLDLDFQGQTAQELHGPRDYTMTEATRILGASIGRLDLGYIQFPYEDTRQALLGMGMGASLAGLYVDMSRAFNEGRLIPSLPRSAATTTPTTLEQFAAEVFAPAFNAPS